MKKVLVMCIALVLAVSAVIGGTVAYLTDTDSAVNVAVVGNVDIEQLEKERIEQSDANTAASNLQNFTQGLPLYPAYYEGQYADWARDASGNQVYQAFPTGGSSAMWTDKAVGTLDKIVFVENKGTSDAYVRTWFAFEQGSMTEAQFEAVVGQNINDTHWEWETIDNGVEIDGNKYIIKLATYMGKAETNVHPNGVLPKGETTRPSLLQVMFYNSATNEDMKAIDGNGNGTFDILVFSQAMQTQNFETVGAKAALSTGFGDEHPWTGTVSFPGMVNTVEELINACNQGGKVKLTKDLYITQDNVQFRSGRKITAVMKDLEIDLNGHDIFVDLGDGEYADANNPPTLFYVYTGASLTIRGEGNLGATNDACLIWATSQSTGVNIYGGNYFNDNYTTGNPAKPGDAMAIVYSSGGQVNVYGGVYKYDVVPNDCSAFNVQDSNKKVNEIVLHEGVLLCDEMFCQPTDGKQIVLAEGCTLQEVTLNGETWYKVVKA